MKNSKKTILTSNFDRVSQFNRFMLGRDLAEVVSSIGGFGQGDDEGVAGRGLLELHPRVVLDHQLFPHGQDRAPLLPDQDETLCKRKLNILKYNF